MTAAFQLRDGESLTWSGPSNSERLLVRSDYAFVLSGAVLGVLALGAFIASLLAVFGGDGAAAFVGLVVSVAVGAVAVFLMFGRLIRRLRRTKGKSYAITNERVIDWRAARSLGGARGPTEDFDTGSL
jgi:hypothetical protein